MPTGYTAIIEEKENVTFKEFALCCARAFGACVDMRDEPFDKEIPKEFKPNMYHAEKLKIFENEYKNFEKIADNEVRINAKNDFDTELKRIDVNIKRAKEILKRYALIRAKVMKWNPPTSEHVGLKDFMLSQIDMCTKDGREVNYYEEERRKLILKSVEEWKADKKKSLLWSISYHSKEHKAEVERTASRNKWIKDLRHSLEEIKG
jgi:hypothetical protein